MDRNGFSELYDCNNFDTTCDKENQNRLDLAATYFIKNLFKKVFRIENEKVKQYLSEQGASQDCIDCVNEQKNFQTNAFKFSFHIFSKTTDKVRVILLFVLCLFSKKSQRT